ncbi:ribosomal protein L6 [Flexistipes sinusarabici DSM 4947]|uniref:Large ribosomal subunit protein uL6 n=2 Tax=Flexistipes sinusarabici TaxID=2352 RepID=F8E9B4_FLESM|nr:50S ribosomal protein L6 [Flexistipes sinusarabici]AEI14166.1 ribosomal protein L6 [Flexistipes sinusarabici DSM 4947]HCW94069.1 50S ribosomal protein L6 [Flexistipes sinusarabici]
MSRIGKKPIEIPNGVKVSVKDNVVAVEGPKGKLSERIHPLVDVNLDDSNISVSINDESKKSRSLYGLSRTLINNMIIGVSEGFQRTLLIEGVGYRVALKGKSLDFSLGYSHPIVVDPPEGIEFAVEGNQKLIVKGVSKQQVGQVAADIRKLRKPEPYKGKGVRYEDERIIRKAGKSGK